MKNVSQIENAIEPNTENTKIVDQIPHIFEIGFKALSYALPEFLSNLDE